METDRITGNDELSIGRYCKESDESSWSGTSCQHAHYRSVIPNETIGIARLSTGTTERLSQQTRDAKQSSNFQTLVLKFQFEFDLHTFGIRIFDKNLSTIFM